MKQKQIVSMTDLLEQSSRALSGAKEIGAGLLVINTEGLIAADRTAFFVARNDYKAGNCLLAKNLATVRSLTSDGRRFVRTARGVIELTLGTRYSDAWSSVGFNRSLEIPRSPGPMLVLLEAMQRYLAENPTLQVPGIDVTAAQTGVLVIQLKAAQAAVLTQRAELARLKQVRDAAEAQLRKRLRDLILELRQRLGPMDSRWLTFGLNLPGAKNIPSVPENVTVVAVHNTSANVKWDRSERADYYHAWTRVVGVQEEFVRAGSPVDPHFTFDELPPNAEVEVAVSAINNGGESLRSVVIKVITGQVGRREGFA